MSNIVSAGYFSVNKVCCSRAVKDNFCKNPQVQAAFFDLCVEAGLSKEPVEKAFSCLVESLGKLVPEEKQYPEALKKQFTQFFQ